MSKYIRLYFPYLIIGVLFYLLDRENLFINDDLNYAINHVTGEPVRNLFDAIQSQGYDWLHQNGRFIIHTIVQCFCGFLGTEVFWICNTIVFLLWLYGLVFYLQITLKEDVKPLGFLLMTTVLMVPSWGITNLGYISGAVNYLWGGCAYLWFIIWYMKTKEKVNSTSLKHSIFVCVVSVLVGSLQESFCIGIAGYFVLYYIFHFKELRGKIAWMVIGFCLGAAICVLAPANFARLIGSESKAVGILKYVGGIVLVVVNAKTYMLMVLSLIILWYFPKCRLLAKETLSSNALLITTASINALFVVGVAFTGSHQITGIELFSLLVLLFLAYRLCLCVFPKVEKVVTYCCYFLLAILCIPMWKQRASISIAYNEFVQNAARSQSGIAVATDYMKEITLKRGWLRANFVRSQENLSNTAWLSRYLSNGKNDSLFHTILPQSPEYIVNACSDANKVRQGVYRPRGYNFYIICCHTDAKVEKVQIARKVTFWGSIRNRIQSGNPFEVSEQPLSSMFHFVSGKECYYIELDDQNYPIQEVEIIVSN